ncbi:hypothetical protein QYF36_009984 [Acer negundo]|nr:hypothetical protein QYF36_009984 [Acer negundo]
MKKEDGSLSQQSFNPNSKRSYDVLSQHYRRQVPRLGITDQGLGTHLKHWLMHLYSWTRSRMVVSAKPDMGPAVLEYPVLSEFIGTASNMAACKITGQAFSKQGSNLDETSGDRIPALYEERNNDNNRKVGTEQPENSIQ